MRQAFFDIDTQFDFVLPAGALYVPGAEQLFPVWQKLNQLAVQRKDILISTFEAHPEDGEEFRDWKPHCVMGTSGQLKPAATIAGATATVTTLPHTLEEFAGTPQILLEKRHIDCFTNQNLRPLIELLQPERCYVYGVVSEYCVRRAALGLLALGMRVELVVDAIRCLDRAAEVELFRTFTERGGVLTTSAAVLG